MNLDEMKLAVCEKLPELIDWIGNMHTKQHEFFWLSNSKQINWSTEGLQVCHEAEKLIKSHRDWNRYTFALRYTIKPTQHAFFEDRDIACATYEQRLEALCRVWWPERFK